MSVGLGRWLPLIASAGAFLLAVSQTEIRPRPRQGAPPFIVIESESAPKLHPQMLAHRSGAVSGGGFVVIHGWNVDHPLYGRDVAGETAYEVDVPVAGTYWVWVRALWSGACASSATLLIAPKGQAPAPGDPRADRHLVGNDLVHDTWHWVSGPRFSLQAGPHELLLGTRESSASIDCVLLTPDPDFDPERAAAALLGATSAEAGEAPGDKVLFSDSFAGGVGESDLAGSRWKVESGAWKVLRESGLSAAGALSGTASYAEAPTLPFSTGQVMSAVVLSARPGAGVFFGRREDGDGFVARLSGENSFRAYGGKVQLVHIQAPLAERVLAESDAPVREGEWQSLEAGFVGAYCRIYLAGRTVLEASLPRPAEGRAGLYVDGDDRLLRPGESLGSVAPRPSAVVRITQAPPAGADYGYSWPGLAFGYSPEECYVLRWTNVGRLKTYAKRLELVRALASGHSRLLGQSWGIFKPTDRSRLSLEWSSGAITARLGDRAIATAAVDSLSSLGGYVFPGQPCVLFTDFEIRSFGRGEAVDASDASALPPPPAWLALGSGWTASSFKTRRLKGDALIDASGDWGSLAGARIGLHAAGEAPGSGYEAMFSPEPPAWKLLRDGALLKSGTLDPKSLDKRTRLALFQRGPSIGLMQDDVVLWSFRDERPYREGYALCSAAGSGEDIQVQIAQAWDLSCVFHQEAFAARGLGMWKPLEGLWVLSESPQRVDAYLLGTAGPARRGTLEYRGSLDDRELLLEIRLLKESLSAERHLSVLMAAGDRRAGLEEVEVSRLDQETLRCRLRRALVTAEGRLKLDPENRAPILTVFRGADRLQVDLDHQPLAEIRASAPGPLRGLALQVLAPPNEAIAIRSISLQRDPLSPGRVSEETRRRVELLKAAGGR